MEKMNPGSGYPHPQPPPAYDHGQQQQQQFVPPYPPQQGYPPQQPYQPQPPLYPPMTIHQTPIVVEQPVHVMMATQVGPDPSMVTCPSCRNTVVTRMEYEASTKTHIMAALLCIFGCWPCVCIPYCVDSCQNGNHYCPSCGAYIGTYQS